MKASKSLSRSVVSPWNGQRLTRRKTLALLAGTLAQLAGCGGGSSGLDIAGITSGGTGSFTRGTITGFGSIIVNGIRYDIDTAEILEGGTERRSQEDLALGMVVDIAGSARSSPGTMSGLPRAQAYRVNFERGWSGLVERKSTLDTPASFTMLGQTVEVSGETIYSGLAQRFEELQPGQFVRVHGYVDSEFSLIHATRVEALPAQPAAFTLTGVINALDSMAGTAQLGLTPLFWNAPAAPAAAVTTGSFVEATLATDRTDRGFQVLRMEVINAPAIELPDSEDDDGDEAEIHGTISRFRSEADFHVNGIPVLLMPGTEIPGGVVRNGLAVEVKGRLGNGRLLASRIEIKSRSGSGRSSFEFYGRPKDIGPDRFLSLIHI